MRLPDLAGLRVLILGTGREGSAAAESIVPVAASVIAADDNDGASAEVWRERWAGEVPLLIAPNPEELATQVDVVVKSPGISPQHPLVKYLRGAGIAFTSGTDLWLGDHATTTTGVTGSKGKSTTASLIHHLTTALGGDSVLGGNIGVPLLALGDAARTVVELSSYQSQSVTVSPDVVVLTSLFPDHLDWHGSQEQYYSDKLNLIGHGPRRVIVNAEDPVLMAHVDTLITPNGPVDAAVIELVGVSSQGASGRWAVRSHNGADWIMRGDEPIAPRAALRLLGRHNAVNSALALAAVEAAGIHVTARAATEALGSFEPLEHRLEPIFDGTGLTFVNDSLSTNPQAAIQALKAFDSADVTLLVGGQDRGVDYSPLAEHLLRHPITAVVGLPPSGPRILAELERTGIILEQADDMRDAVQRARYLTPAEGTVLLSPAAPSYGIYRDFADRAADFRRAIEATTPTTSDTAHTP